MMLWARDNKMKKASASYRVSEKKNRKKKGENEGTGYRTDTLQSVHWDGCKKSRCL